jgi:hypothetical protein
MAEVDRLTEERERLILEVAAVTEQRESEREQLTAKLSAVIGQRESERERLTAELAAVIDHRDALTTHIAMQQYENERQRTRAAENYAKARQLESQLQVLAAVIDHRDVLKAQVAMQQRENERQRTRAQEDLARVQQLESQLQVQRQGQVTPADLDLLYSKLAAQITRLSADLTSRIGGGAVSGQDSADLANAARYLNLLQGTLTGQLTEDAR